MIHLYPKIPENFMHLIIKEWLLHQPVPFVTIVKDKMIRLYPKISENFMYLIIKEWLKHEPIPFVTMVKFNSLA